MKFVFLLLIFGCASRPTSYGPLKNKEGYKDKVIDDDLLAVTFRANEHTKKNRAELFAKFRAIENCSQKGRQLAQILDVVDRTTSKEVVTTDSFGPSYYYGMSPYYGRYYGGLGMSVGIGSYSSRSYSQTYTYPEYEVFYLCKDIVKDAQVFFKQISPENMKLLVKDLKGGLQVERILDDSPNLRTLEVGDIVIRGNDKRIETLLDLFRSYRDSRTNKEFKIEILREGVKKRVSLKVKDVSEVVEKKQFEVIQAACADKQIKKTRPICKGN